MRLKQTLSRVFAATGGMLVAATVLTAAPGGAQAAAPVPGRAVEAPVVDQARTDVNVGSAPMQVEFSPDSRRAYVLNSVSDSMSVVDPSAATVVATISLPAHPVAMVVSADGRSVYVTSSGVDGVGGAVSVIDTATRAVRQRLSLEGGPAGLALRPGTTELWVNQARWWRAAVLDSRTLSELRSVELEPSGRMRFSSDGATLYSADGHFGAYTLANGATDSWGSDARQLAQSPDLTRTYEVYGNYVYDREGDRQTLGGYGGAMAFRPDSSEAFVLRGNSSTYPDRVARMDARRFTITSEFAVGSRPSDLKVSPDGMTLITANTGDGTVSIVRLSPQQPPAGLSVDRISGGDRFAVSAALSQRGFPSGAPIAYVASGVGFADALSAAPAAAKQGGPVLLTMPWGLPDAVRAELVRLHPAKIVVVGGAASVSEAVKAQLARIAPVKTVWGADRFATSRAVVDDAFGVTAELFVAAGENFPDALSAGAAAAKRGAPVLLVRGRTPYVYGVADEDVKALTQRHNVGKVTFVGGPASLSDGATSWSTWTWPQTVRRVWGPDRYSTSIAVNAEVFGSAPQVYVASGLGYPDALGGSALAASSGSPLYVIPPGCVPRPLLAELGALSATRLTVVGGPAAVSPDVDRLVVCG